MQNTLVLGSTTDPSLCPRCSVHVELAVAPYPGMAIITGPPWDHTHFNGEAFQNILDTALAR